MPKLLTRLDLRGLDGDLRSVLPAPAPVGDGPVQPVREVLAAVKAGGDAAVEDLTRRFDGVRPPSLRVPAEEITAASRAVPSSLRQALEEAARAIRQFHEAERAAHRSFDHIGEDGISTRELLVPVRRAGCYAPGGRAPLASSVLMTAIPARVAGVDEVVLCSPPGPDGRVAAPVLAAAAIAGVDEVYAIGGAQAIAAMAYGTTTVGAVDVIAGPGNLYVAVAQRLVAQEGIVGVPSAFAGPSEVVVVADDSAPAAYAAIDIVVQAEHGPDGLSWLVTWSEEVAGAVEEEVERLTALAPRRQEIAATLERGGWSVLVDGPAAGDGRMQRGGARTPGTDHSRPRGSGPSRAVGRCCFLWPLGPGQRRGLHRRPEPRAADGQERQVLERPRHGRLLEARPRREPGP